MSEILEDEEIDRLTHPITQHAAQKRHLSKLLGLQLKTRPDGMPIVTRTMLARLDQGEREKTAGGDAGLNWGTG